MWYTLSGKPVALHGPTLSSHDHEQKMYLEAPHWEQLSSYCLILPCASVQCFLRERDKFSLYHVSILGQTSPVLTVYPGAGLEPEVLGECVPES